MARRLRWTRASKLLRNTRPVMARGLARIRQDCAGIRQKLTRSVLDWGGLAGARNRDTHLPSSSPSRAGQVPDGSKVRSKPGWAHG